MTLQKQLRTLRRKSDVLFETAQQLLSTSLLHKILAFQTGTVKSMKDDNFSVGNYVQRSFCLSSSPQMTWTLANESSAQQRTETTNKQLWINTHHLSSNCSSTPVQKKSVRSLQHDCVNVSSEQTCWNLHGRTAQQPRIKRTSAFPEFNSGDFTAGEQWMICVRRDPADVRQRQWQQPMRVWPVNDMPSLPGG